MEPAAAHLIYGRWFVLFAARTLLGHSGKPLPKSAEGAKALAQESIALVARACSQGKAVAHYQLFRSPRTRDEILAEFNGKQISLFDLLDTLP